MLSGNLRKKHQTNPTIQTISNASKTCTSSKKTCEPKMDHVMDSCWTSVSSQAKPMFTQLDERKQVNSVIVLNTHNIPQIVRTRGIGLSREQSRLGSREPIRRWWFCSLSESTGLHSHQSHQNGRNAWLPFSSTLLGRSGLFVRRV